MSTLFWNGLLWTFCKWCDLEFPAFKFSTSFLAVLKPKHPSRGVHSLPVCTWHKYLYQQLPHLR